MIILGRVFPSLQKMTTFTNVAQLIWKENNARDYTTPAKKQRNLYFVTVSIEQQVGKSLEVNGIWTKNQLYKKLPSCSIIRDIVDGIEYKKFKQNGGFLTNKDHLTLLFNTSCAYFKASELQAWLLY